MRPKVYVSWYLDSPKVAKTDRYKVLTHQSWKGASRQHICIRGFMSQYSDNIIVRQEFTNRV